MDSAPSISVPPPSAATSSGTISLSNAPAWVARAARRVVRYPESVQSQDVAPDEAAAETNDPPRSSSASRRAVSTARAPLPGAGRHRFLRAMLGFFVFIVVAPLVAWLLASNGE